MCQSDVSIQYVYWEVEEGDACQVEFDDFILTNAGFPPPQIFFATLAEAQTAYPGVPQAQQGQVPRIATFYRRCLADGFQTGKDYWVVVL
jgi:hypothetical protein